MFECQIMCTKLTVLFDGIMICVGSPDNLIRKYGKGYSVIIYIINERLEEHEEQLHKIKRAIIGSFQNLSLIHI